MTARLAQIWRHPIKSHGRETLETVEISTGQTLPWDRHWAVAHDQSKAENNAWFPCVNFSRVSQAPQLMAITATLDEAQRHVTLRHPARPDLEFRPDADGAAFLDWVAPLMPDDRASSAQIVSAGTRGMTDNSAPTISIASLSSLDALSRQMGTPLSAARFRANLWIEGLAPWEEAAWVGRTMTVGGTRFEIIQRIDRCTATMANPDTGARDADPLTALRAAGQNIDFGLHAVAVSSGQITAGDLVALL